MSCQYMVVGRLILSILLTIFFFYPENSFAQNVTTADTIQSKLLDGPYLQTALAVILGAFVSFLGVICAQIVSLRIADKQAKERYREIAFHRLLDSVEKLELIVIKVRHRVLLTNEEKWLFVLYATNSPESIRAPALKVFKSLNTGKDLANDEQISILHSTIADFRQTLLPEII